MVEKLDYASSATPDTRDWLTLAAICGAASLSGGFAITGLFAATGWGLWKLLGLLWVVVGFVLFVAGVIFLWRASVAIYRGRLGQSAPTAWTFLKLFGVILLLPASFPACRTCIDLATRASSQYHVKVINRTNVPIDSISLSLHGTSTVLGRIPPDSSDSCTLQIAGEGALRGVATIGGTPIPFEANEYVESGIAGSGPYWRTVTFTSPTTRPTIK